MTSWKIYWEERPDHGRTYVAANDGDVKKLLGDAVAMWTRDRNLHEWDATTQMAAICFYYSDLTEREITAIFGDSGEGHYPGDPDWTLPHPDGGTLHIERNTDMHPT